MLPAPVWGRNPGLARSQEVPGILIQTAVLNGAPTGTDLGWEHITWELWGADGKLIVSLGAHTVMRDFDSSSVLSH